MRRWSYLMEDTVRGMGRRLPLLAATTGLLTGALLMAGFALLVYVNLSNVVRQAQGEVRLRVQVRDDVPAAEVETLGRRLRAFATVVSVGFTSKQQAEEEFLAESVDNRRLLAGLGEYPLPASYEVRLRAEVATPAGAGRVVEEIQALPGVEEVLYAQAWLTHAARAIRIIEWSSWLVTGVVGCAVVAIVSMAMRLTFYARREEVEVLQLLGAPPWTLVFPFTIEGMVLGLVGGGLALAALAGLWTVVGTQVAFVPVFLGPSAMAGLLAAGAALGGLGGWVPLRPMLRYGDGPRP